MRSIGITFLSLALTVTVIGNAYYQKKQFYPSVVYITKSNPSMAVIYIQAFILVLLMGKIMRKLFFGQLRTAEFEHLMERSWYAITETCLAFTVFRDDFNPKFVALFTVLLFLKSFHWLVEDRVDYMERSPVISWVFHLRVLSLLLLLGFLDLHFVGYAYLSTVTKGASVQLVFGFEYAILMTMVINVAIKYTLHTIDLNSENPWENKAVFLLYTELIMGLIKVLLYISFVAIMVRIYTLPLFAFRPMYYTMRNFKRAFNDVILSRRAIRNMNTLYPDATPEELQAADNVCIICREEMVTASKKLPCNHIFHTACLRSWFQRQQTCPTCRLNILRPPAATSTRAAAAPQQPPRAQPQQPAANQILGMPAVNPFQLFGGVNPFQGLGGGAAPPIWPGANGAAPAQQPAATTPTASTSTSASASGATPQSVNATPLPFAIPPFPFMPFTIPPPIPPPNLSALSTEELRRLEGVERENVEARIQLLRNIQLMLDASVIMMQQYSAAAAASYNKTSTQTKVESTAVSSNSEASTSNGAGPSSSETSGSNDGNVTSSDAATLKATTTSTTKESQNNASASSSTAPTANGEYDELRRRRLQRFQLAEQQPQ